MGFFPQIISSTESARLSARRAHFEEVRELRAEVRRLKARLQELDHLANTDSLVQLPNRRSFESALESLIGRVERYGETASMIFVDVDGLKWINDCYGHKAGDEALVAVARVLETSVRKSDFVARLSGDEFAILMFHADELTAWNMGLRIVEAVVNTDFAVGEKRVGLSVAVGVGEIRATDTAESVILRADQAMYAVKAA